MVFKDKALETGNWPTKEDKKENPSRIKRYKLQSTESWWWSGSKVMKEEWIHFKT